MHAQQTTHLGQYLDKCILFFIRTKPPTVRKLGLGKCLLDAVLLGYDLSALFEFLPQRLGDVTARGRALGQHRAQHVPLAVVEVGRLRQVAYVRELVTRLLLKRERAASEPSLLARN